MQFSGPFVSTPAALRVTPPQPDAVRGYHLTDKQLSEIWKLGGIHLQEGSDRNDVRVFDCHCDAFLHNEHSQGAYDLARFLARNPKNEHLDLCNFSQMFCEKSQQVAFLSHKFYKDNLPEHINTWELVRILFCDFFGEFAVNGEREPPRPLYLPEDEMCRETIESLLCLPGEKPKLQVLCRCLHWLEQTARRADWHDPSEGYFNSITQFDKSCSSSALFDPDSNPGLYKRTRVDLSEPVYHAIRRGDARFAAEMLVKNKEYWFSSFVRLCAPTFFNLQYDAHDDVATAPSSGSPPKEPKSCVFLPKLFPFVHTNELEKIAKQRKYFKDHADKDNGDLSLCRHDMLDCGSSAPQLLHGLELLRCERCMKKSDLVDDKSFMQKALSALSDNCNFRKPPSQADLQLAGQDFLWKNLRSAWVNYPPAFRARGLYHLLFPIKAASQSCFRCIS
jgi:hypothetical protein